MKNCHSRLLFEFFFDPGAERLREPLSRLFSEFSRERQGQQCHKKVGQKQPKNGFCAEKPILELHLTYFPDFRWTRNPPFDLFRVGGLLAGQSPYKASHPPKPFLLGNSEGWEKQTFSSKIEKFKCCPGQPAEMCRRIFDVLVFLEDLLGHFPGGFFWALFPQKWRENNRRENLWKKYGGSKIEIREKSVLPKAGPNKWDWTFRARSFSFKSRPLRIWNYAKTLFCKEGQMYCWVQYPLVFFAFLGMTLDNAETPFAKKTFSWFLILFELL